MVFLSSLSGAFGGFVVGGLISGYFISKRDQIKGSDFISVLLNITILSMEAVFVVGCSLGGAVIGSICLPLVLYK